MFIPRSTARLRLARAVFVLLALVPAAVIAAWASHLRSTAHLDDVRRTWQRAMGLSVDLESVEHPRPGVVRVGGCAIADPAGRVRVTIPGAELETTASELRLRVGRLRCDAAAARLLATLAADWLARGQRFDHDCIVEIDDFGWADEAGGTHGEAPAGLRIECVATDEARAVRVVHRPRAAHPGGIAGPAADVEVEPRSPASEVRVVRSVAVDAMRPQHEDAGRGADVRVKVTGTCARPVPFPVVAALAGETPLRDWSLGVAAAVTGRIDIGWDERGWRGTMTGRIVDVDLAACGAALGLRAAGSAVVDVRTIRWSDGRVAECELQCEAGPGEIARTFVEGLVATIGCRPGRAWSGDAAQRAPAFTAAGALVRIDGNGVELLAIPRLGGALLVAAGEGLLWPPPAPVAVERLAWLLAPPDAPRVPAGGPAAWLMSVMPRDEGDRASRPVVRERPERF